MLVVLVGILHKLQRIIWKHHVSEWKDIFVHQNVFFLWSILPSCSCSRVDIRELCINTDECGLELCKGLWGRGGRGYDSKVGGGYTVCHAACNDPQPESVCVQSCCKNTHTHKPHLHHVFDSLLCISHKLMYLFEQAYLMCELWLLKRCGSSKKITIIYSHSLLTVTLFPLSQFPREKQEWSQNSPQQSNAVRRLLVRQLKVSRIKKGATFFTFFFANIHTDTSVCSSFSIGPVFLCEGIIFISQT